MRVSEDELVAELIATCGRHLTPSETAFVRACFAQHRAQILMHLRAAPQGVYVDDGMARRVLKCAETIMGGVAN